MTKSGNEFQDIVESSESTHTEHSEPSQKNSSSQTETSSTTSPSENTEYLTVEKPAVENSDPFFRSQDVSQSQLYLSDQQLIRLDDLKHEVRGSLRSSFEIRNAEVREIDEAITRLAVQTLTGDDIAKEIVRLRGYSVDDT